MDILHMMSQPCDGWNDVCLVCGVAGYLEHLISCSGCNLTKEHRYCMKVVCLSKEAECSWICDECKQFEEDLDNAPISAVFSLKKDFTKLEKDASKTGKKDVSDWGKYAYFDDNICVEVQELKESHRQVVEKATFQEEKKATFQEEKSLMTNEHGITVLQEEVDATLMISGSLNKRNADVKRRKKVVVSDSSDDELTTNVQHEPADQLNTDSGGSFSLWLDDATKLNEYHAQVVEKATFQEEKSLMTDEHGLTVLQEEVDAATLMISGSLNKRNADVKRGKKVVVSDSSDDELTTNVQHEPTDHLNTDSGGSFSLWLDDVTKDTVAITNCDSFSFDSMVETHEGKSCEYVNGVSNLSLGNNNVALCDNALVNVNENGDEKITIDASPVGNNLQEKSSLINNDVALFNSNALVKRTVAKRASADDACDGEALVKPDPDCDNGLISHDGTNGNDVTKYQMGAFEDFDRAANYVGRVNDSSPVDTISWRGYFSLGHSNYGIMHAHLSTNFYHDDHVNEGVKKLKGVVNLEKVPNRIAWPPKFYSTSSPTHEDIHLFIFPKNMGSERETHYWFDKLVRELHARDLSYRAILDCSELLLFPSVLLPDYYQKFLGRRYLWGAFSPKQTDFSKPENRGFHLSNRSNENQGRASSSHGLKRNSISVTHDTSHKRKRESGVFCNRRADEGRNRLKLMPAPRLSVNCVDERHKNGSDSSAAHCADRFSYKYKSTLKVIPLQVENIAVVNKLDEQSVPKPELNIG